VCAEVERTLTGNLDEAIRYGRSLAKSHPGTKEMSISCRWNGRIEYFCDSGCGLEYQGILDRIKLQRGSQGMISFTAAGQGYLWGDDGKKS